MGERVVKKSKKILKKVLTALGRCGIIYKSTRYGNKLKPKLLDKKGFGKEDNNLSKPKR